MIYESDILCTSILIAVMWVCFKLLIAPERNVPWWEAEQNSSCSSLLSSWGFLHFWQEQELHFLVRNHHFIFQYTITQNMPSSRGACHVCRACTFL